MTVRNRATSTGRYMRTAPRGNAAVIYALAWLVIFIIRIYGLTVNSLNFEASFLLLPRYFYGFIDLQHGEVQCRPVECPELPCKHPVNITGECCQSCLSKYLLIGIYFEFRIYFSRTVD